MCGVSFLQMSITIMDQTVCSLFRRVLPPKMAGAFPIETTVDKNSGFRHRYTLLSLCTKINAKPLGSALPLWWEAYCQGLESTTGR